MEHHLLGRARRRLGSAKACTKASGPSRRHRAGLRIQNHRCVDESPVGLNGDPASPAPYYCATTAQFCYADRYNSAGQVAATSLVRPPHNP